MNGFEVQKGYSFTVKADYNSIKGLADTFEDFYIEPVDPVCIITVRRVGNSGNKYRFNYHCGIGECESLSFRCSMEVDVEDGEKPEIYALRSLKNLLDNADWFEIIREYRNKHEPDVFKEWLDSQDKLNLKWAVEYFARDADSFKLVMEYEDGTVYTCFWLKALGNEWPLPAYAIDGAWNPVEKRNAAKENYEIYLRLLYQFFGIEPFMDTAQMMGFENYMKAIRKCISEDAGSFEWCWHLPGCK